MEIWHLVYFNNELVQNLGHINIFLEHWAQLFEGNLSTCRLAIKLEGTLVSAHLAICFLLFFELLLGFGLGLEFGLGLGLGLALG